MKRLLAAGSGDIYQICKVFRDDELGRNHNPEFTMLEWYRQGFDHVQLMDEIQQLLVALFEKFNPQQALPSFARISYRQAFLDSLSTDPLTATASELKQCAVNHDIEVPVGMEDENKDMWLDWLMTQAVAPAFSSEAVTFVYDYPASQAALARLSDEDPRVAHRFEMYFGELELANGFYELTDAQQQRQRFTDENKRRRDQGMELMPVDEDLLAALESGMPDCAGVALGIDRLLMVLTGSKNIRDVLSFPLDLFDKG